MDNIPLFDTLFDTLDNTHTIDDRSDIAVPDIRNPPTPDFTLTSVTTRTRNSVDVSGEENLLNDTRMNLSYFLLFLLFYTYFTMFLHSYLLSQPSISFLPYRSTTLSRYHHLLPTESELSLYLLPLTYL
jgi:hypothetical protein